MSYNGNGVFSITSPGQPVIPGTVISTSTFNALTADLATGLSTALCKDGQSTPSANIKMGGYKLTGLGAAATSGDALSYGSAGNMTTLSLSGALTYGGVTLANAITGTGNMVLSSSPSFSGTIGGNLTWTGSQTVQADISCGHITALGAGGGTFLATGFGTQAQYDISGITSQNGSGVNVICISNGVTLSNSATSWASISDDRMKTAFTPFNDALLKVASIKNGIGRYLTDPEDVSRSFLSAQSVQEVLPEAVSEGTDGTLVLRYSEVIPLVVAALAEVNTRLVSLAAKIDG